MKSFPLNHFEELRWVAWRLKIIVLRFTKIKTGGLIIDWKMAKILEFSAFLFVFCVLIAGPVYFIREIRQAMTDMEELDQYLVQEFNFSNQSTTYYFSSFIFNPISTYLCLLIFYLYNYFLSWISKTIIY